MDSTLSLKVSDIMSRPVRSVASDCTLDEVARQMAEARISSLLVMDQQSLLGIITERDLLRMLNVGAHKDTPATEFMSKPVITVSPDTDFDEAYSIAIDHQVRHLVVIDELRSVIGLVCDTDFRRHLDNGVLRQLDELNMIMDQNLPLLAVDESLAKALSLMQTSRSSYVVVLEDKRPVGILTERDIPRLLASLEKSVDLISVREVMQKPVQTVLQKSPIFGVIELMQKRRLRHIVVVNDAGQTVGMVTQHRMLERISVLLTHNKVLHLEGSKRISDDLLSLAAEASRLGFFECNLVAREIRCSDTLLNELGLSAEDARPMGPHEWLERVHPDDNLALRNNCRAILQCEETLIDSELRLRHKDGHWLWMQLKGRVIEPDEAGNPRTAVVTAMNITQRKAAEEKMVYLAYFDALTGLPNRVLLLDRLKQELAGSVRNNHIGALLLINVDNFKTINGTLGHEAGDVLLKQIVQRLKSCIREGDTLARIGGDEFVVMLRNLSEDAFKAAALAETIGEKIRALFDQFFEINSSNYRSTSSIGATLFDGRESGMENLMRQIDIAMHQAKKVGGNCLRFFDVVMQEAIIAHAALESDLRKAVAEAEEFLLFYQPQVDQSGRMIGVEALVRWKHPERGVVSPAQFIPLAEETGLILPLGHWVLETACRQLEVWAKRPETARLTMSVNISAKQLQLPTFVEEVLAQADYFKIPPKRLKLEITESMLLSNIDDTIAKMEALKARNISFSLDDFGTGYSSLQYLKRLPLEQLKIDQAFVRDIVTDESDKVIVRTIIAMANSLRLNVIAEGVETEGQRQLLQNEGAIQYQGYLFGRPVPIEQFELLLKLPGSNH